MRRLTDLQAKILPALEQQVADDDVNFKRLADAFGIYPDAGTEASA